MYLIELFAASILMSSGDLKAIRLLLFVNWFSLDLIVVVRSISNFVHEVNHLFSYYLISLIISITVSE